jgi:hypothetical protein
MMNDRAIELFKRAGAEAYELCKKHDHTVGEIDTIWVSIMAGTLSELVVKECCQHLRDVGGPEFAESLEAYFGVE